MQVTLEFDLLKALALFKAKKDIRYYLNGIYIETSAKGARLVATDGHRLAIAKLDGGYPESSIIVPDTVIDVVLKDAAARKMGMVTFEYGDGHRGGALRKVYATSVFGDEVDGVYPDWRRVIPEKVTEEIAYYNPEYLLDVSKAASYMGHKNTALVQNGVNAGVAVVYNLMMIVMPIRRQSLNLDISDISAFKL